MTRNSKCTPLTMQFSSLRTPSQSPRCREIKVMSLATTLSSLTTTLRSLKSRCQHRPTLLEGRESWAIRCSSSIDSDCLTSIRPDMERAQHAQEPALTRNWDALIPQVFPQREAHPAKIKSTSRFQHPPWVRVRKA